MDKFAKKIKKVFFLSFITNFYNLVQGFQLDTTQWQEVDITNNFIQQNFIQFSGDTRIHDSLQLSQTKYANLIRSSDESDGEILIQVLDEYGNQQCSKTISVEYICKYSLTNTNVEGEFFFAYTSEVSLNFYQVFFGFSDQKCNFNRGLSAPVQPVKFTDTSFFSVLSKKGKEYIYVVIQQFQSSSQRFLYLMIVDIRDTSTYKIKKHVKLGTTNFRYNLFSFQAFSDDYAVILGKDDNDRLNKITIEPSGSSVWDTPKDKGIFLDLNTNNNFIQNKVIQIENTNKYSIVTGDREQDILTIYTFQYNGNGEIQDICLESYQNQFGSVGNQFFRYLEFGVINQDFIWIKGEKENDNKKTLIFFANPLDCQVYRNPEDSSIYQYQLDHFGLTHIFHTSYINQTVSLIASSSHIDGNDSQNLKAIRIILEGKYKQFQKIYQILSVQVIFSNINFIIQK
ncbi:hypothetical protein PPERSA_05348 [Pseudocohnilembus persalinus]|uniref:WD40-repeat-containing domain n=1 Tax=Pseudocohnilembus persalinus TaxID=266149 RepID=A0A0V0R625_PSEPJ|nr:hypothetical protein PPERSA_05348 [Pseudocohnilembus persalinus]|eukprot:KRX09956.1 hypothetical protein PPERSA_05348 [Pseudocohnilembus persalinus]